jgi:hypothetical protein
MGVIYTTDQFDIGYDSLRDTRAKDIRKALKLTREM